VQPAKASRTLVSGGRLARQGGPVDPDVRSMPANWDLACGVVRSGNEVRHRRGLAQHQNTVRKTLGNEELLAVAGRQFHSR